MLAHNFLLCLVFSLQPLVFADEDFYQVSACCTFKGPHFEETEYILVSSFNKRNMMEFNSTRGNWTGFTEYSIRAAKMWNNDPSDKLLRMLEMQMLCENNKKSIQTMGKFFIPPIIKVKSVQQSDSEHPAMIVCSAYDFYPKHIRLTWLRNGQEVTEGVSYSDVMSDGDLDYQSLSHLEYFPVSGEKITCMVEHSSLSEPKLVEWDESRPVGEKVQIAVGLCGVLLGLVLLSSGFIYYKKRSAAYNAVCQGQRMIPVEDQHEVAL